ncbi:MAG: transposase [Candidatus Kapaibacterium sp.]
MPQSHGHIYLHVVFSTKNREPFLRPELHIEFSRYISPILKDCKASLIIEGGMSDHVHLLIDLGRESSVATIMREVKSKSSAWLRNKIGKNFNWQNDMVSSA